ncbi:hypothetical protein N7494_012372 [Penicillium frequentans]|uniref:Uncharacterized protein n=1 Tax=Penicillium frequentans TaxID=3151616 RepID=A0AAD6CP95_9EURO|nr:hypothetical protein N7494_012372 [Penicillium glabrum]
MSVPDILLGVAAGSRFRKGMQGADVVDRANEAIEFHSFGRQLIHVRYTLQAVFMWPILGV